MYLFDNVGWWLENEMDIRAYRNVYATSTLQGIDREQKGIWKLQSLVDASWFSQFFGDTCVRFKLHGVTDGACVLHLKECKLGSENVFVRGCAGCTNHCVETIGMESVTTKEDNHSGRWFPGILGMKISIILQSSFLFKSIFCNIPETITFWWHAPQIWSSVEFVFFFVRNRAISVNLNFVLPRIAMPLWWIRTSLSWREKQSLTRIFWLSSCREICQVKFIITVLSSPYFHNTHLQIVVMQNFDQGIT